MLLSLHIENFALVDQLDLDLGAGLNVLTGETGAGKSVILDALDAALGGKVTSRGIRAGSDRSMVEATFALNLGLIEWLAEQQIPRLDECSLVCSREMTVGRGGVRGRSRVNGIVVNQQQMQSLRDRLVEITAQGQTLQLGKPNQQREWLDGFGGSALLKQRRDVANAFSATQQAWQALEKRRQYEQQRLQQLDLFEYQAKELNAAYLEDPNELQNLEQERQRLSHSVELQQQSYQVYQALYETDDDRPACADLLGKAESILQAMHEVDRQIQPILELVSSALTQVEEAGREINTYGDTLETDPERLQMVEERIIQLKQICRKYGPTLEEAIAYSQQVQADLSELSDGGQSLDVLEQIYQDQQERLQQVCAKLTELRQSAAQRFEALLLAELKPLAMDKVQFQVEISPIAPTVSGADRVVFQFSPNPGEPVQPLTEIASGGEMSRFLLALKACLSHDLSAMVFDEIDTGVSGRVAQAIAEKLHLLSRRAQVLCVTHQPIIAAMADNHFRVNKTVIGDGVGDRIGDGATSETGKRKRKSTKAKSDPDTATATSASNDVRTVVRVVPLNDAERLEELAQLAGGKTDQEAIAFAESLRSQATLNRSATIPSQSTQSAQTDNPSPGSTHRTQSVSKLPAEKRTSDSEISDQQETNSEPDHQTSRRRKTSTATQAKSSKSSKSSKSTTARSSKAKSKTAKAEADSSEVAATSTTTRTSNRQTSTRKSTRSRSCQAS